MSGSAGFIGSHLVEKLLDEGNEVIGVDDLSVGKLDNLKDVLDSPRFTFINADVRNISNYASRIGKVDYIFHLAAKADIVPSIKYPREYFESNVEGTLALLEFARNLKIGKFLYTASSSCYGIPVTYPTSEDAKIDPKYPYALTKFLGEQLALHWGHVYGIPVISLRLFNVYGPRARTSGTYGAVFGVFLAQKVSGLPLTVVGDGNQTRDFTYVSDIVQAFIDSAWSDCANEVFNVGSGGSYSINRLVELLDCEKVHIPKRPGEPDVTFADIARISSKIGWQPKVQFEEGVAMLIEQIDQWKSAPKWTVNDIEIATKEWFHFLGGDH